MAGFLLLTYSSGSAAELEHPLHFEPSAVIIDQLSLTYPNASFVKQATTLLKEAGYTVDYHPGKNATVDFYRRLPQMGYDVLILRTHSSANHQNKADKDVVLFTGEEYDPAKHVDDQRQGRLSRIGFSPQQYAKDGKTYFGIRPGLLKEADGNFSGATVLMMGCQGNMNPTLADAFLEKGASWYVGWNESVTAQQTDAVSLKVLEKALHQTPIDDAVHEAMNGSPSLKHVALQISTRTSAN